MIKVLITDDHPVVRQGIRQILTEYSDIELVDEAGGGSELFEKARETRYDVILLDISMPGKTGLELLKDVKVLCPETAVLILSVHPETQYAIRALKSGASGYLPKSTLPDELITAVRKAAAGKKYITSSLADILATDFDQPDEKPIYQSLSDREFDVLIQLASGKSIKEIGEDLSLSAKTISTYRERILEKLSLKNTAEIIRFAIQEGLVD
ncbi:MAG: response regulator transcription factor [Bacteroidales bacterium]|nr:response regulator transcription factor [Bacteroidales bacterium]